MGRALRIPTRASNADLSSSSIKILPQKVTLPLGESDARKRVCQVPPTTSQLPRHGHAEHSMHKWNT